MQRQRTGGADDAVVFVVHLEATGKPIIAARWYVHLDCSRAPRALPTPPPLTLLRRLLLPPRSLPPGNVIHISSTADDFTTFGETHLATVACNFLGTQFSIVDYGLPAGERADGTALGGAASSPPAHVVPLPHTCSPLPPRNYRAPTYAARAPRSLSPSRQGS